MNKQVMNKSRSGVCVCLLCGLPAAGKSTLTHLISDHLHSQGYKTFIISYDQLIPNHVFEFSTSNEGEDSSKEYGMWKQHRQAVLECLDGFLQDPGAVGPHTHAGMSVYDGFKQEMEKQQILQALQNTDVDPHHLVILLDDNYYYQSMRYQVYQLARKHLVGFCQVYLRCPVDVCLHRNRLRGRPVSDDVIVQMSDRMEPPNVVKNQWERNSITLDNTQHLTGTHIENLLHLIGSAVENPLSPLQDDSKEREADRERCASSVVHQADQACRRLVSQAMITARENKRSAEALKSLARDLSEQKSTFLQELRGHVLHELVPNECVCVEKVVDIATATFKHRTDAVMERYG
ncbi:L-seryl-tRNA(Sec) kinase [Trichomycterus rosablanca]|uniref:L-seryl-tRNA(Sec) kinase n=1 Tax=Trichomycterus rosablanca TaxID=2290929 RepID=UPI002F35069B